LETIEKNRISNSISENLFQKPVLSGNIAEYYKTAISAAKLYR